MLKKFVFKISKIQIKIFKNQIKFYSGPPPKPPPKNVTGRELVEEIYQNDETKEKKFEITRDEDYKHINGYSDEALGRELVIYKHSKSSTQHNSNDKEVWKIKWTDVQKKWSDPLMGWTGGSVNYINNNIGHYRTNFIKI
jgi:hypothetical protein